MQGSVEDGKMLTKGSLRGGIVVVGNCRAATKDVQVNGVMCLLLPDSPTQIMIGMVITFVL